MSWRRSGICFEGKCCPDRFSSVSVVCVRGPVGGCFPSHEALAGSIVNFCLGVLNVSHNRSLEVLLPPLRASASFFMEWKLMKKTQRRLVNPSNCRSFASSRASDLHRHSREVALVEILG